MSETATLWLFGTLITLLTIVLGAIAAALWTHIVHCKDVTSAVARIEANVSRIKEDIGDHDSGMRGDLHSYGGDIHYHGLCIWNMARKIGMDLPPREKKR